MLRHNYVNTYGTVERSLQKSITSPRRLLWLPNVDFKFSRSIFMRENWGIVGIRLKEPHWTIVARPVIISKKNSNDELDKELTARSCCGPLLCFYLQIDGQRFSWRSYIFLEEKGPFTSPYFWLLLPTLDFPLLIFS